eukprot:7303622-Pyramimonas_sp.AAC.1
MGSPSLRGGGTRGRRRPRRSGATPARPRRDPSVWQQCKMPRPCTRAWVRPSRQSRPTGRPREGPAKRGRSSRARPRRGRRWGPDTCPPGRMSRRLAWRRQVVRGAGSR